MTTTVDGRPVTFGYVVGYLAQMADLASEREEHHRANDLRRAVELVEELERQHDNG